MLELILTLILGIAPKSADLTQVTTCQWPNTCGKKVEVTAQVRTCVWPNVCAKQETEVLAQVRTCQWPNTCAKAS